MEMVDSVDDLKSSRSIQGYTHFPNFEMLDARIALALNKIIQNSYFKKKVSLEEQNAQKEDRFSQGRQIAYMIYDYFRATGPHETVLDYADLFSVTLRDDNVQDFGTRYCELRKCESDQLKTVLELYDMEIHQKISMPNYQQLKTMMKRSIDQKLRLRKIDARHEKIERGAVIKSRKGLSGIVKGKGICYQWKETGQCSKGDQCSFPHESNDRAQTPTPKASPPCEPSMTRGRSTSRKKEKSKAKVRLAEFFDCRADTIWRYLHEITL